MDTAEGIKRFTKGDRVRRVQIAAAGMPIGSEWVVESCGHDRRLWVYDHSMPMGFNAEWFELVQPAQPQFAASEPEWAEAQTIHTGYADLMVGKLAPRPIPTDPAIVPDHYTQFKFEPLRVDVENYGRGILVHKISKYVMRAPFKNGQQDLAKAARCLEMLTRFDAGDPNWWMKPEDHAKASAHG